MILSSGSALQTALAQQLLDDFNRPNSALVGGTWTEGGTGSQGEINGNRLRINTGGISGRDWVMQDASSYYGTQLASNSCILDWAFNIRQSRANPSGLNGSNYGVAFILAGSSPDPTQGQGYAVIIGQSGTTDPLKLVRYTNGLVNNANVTTIIDYNDFGAEFLDVRVTYDPAGDQWEMFTEDNGTGGPFGNPLLASTLAGAGVDGTYTALNLAYVGCLWNHATTAADHALFDNIHIPSNCAPATPAVAFPTAGTSGLEGTMGTFPVIISIVPPSPTPTTIDVLITNAAGVLYGPGNDYITAPNGATNSFTIAIPANAGTAMFDVTVINDLLIEATETVTFELSNPTGGTVLGSSTQHVVTIGDDDTPPAVLERGDLIIVGINANNGSCSGTGGEDEISFFCFKDITANTTIDLTDNGYERCNAGLWADSEGTIRATRTGPTIPAGSVITFRSSGTGSYSAAGPDGLWSFTSLNGATNNLAMNSGGDQIFFLQGGAWINPVGTHNASYLGGRVLYGFSTNNSFPWTAICPTASGGTQRSNLPIQMECFSMAPTSATDFAKYTGPISATNQRGWIVRIGSPANWTTYSNCGTYNSSGPNYVGGYLFTFTTTGFTPGLWVGATNTDWFECTNWDDAQVPDATIDVRIDDSATRNCDVATGGTAVCNDLEIDLAGTTNRILSVESNSILSIAGNMTISIANGSTADATARVRTGGRINVNDVTLDGSSPLAGGEAMLQNQELATVLNVDGDLTIGDGGRLDLQDAAVGGLLELEGDFINNHDDMAFEYLRSRIVMDGSGPQSIGGSLLGVETFYELEINKPFGDVTINNIINVRADLNFLSGRVLNSQKVVFFSGATATSMSNSSFATGQIEKLGTDDFIFPVGKSNFFRPLEITSLTNGNAASGMVCEYMLLDPVGVYGNLLDPSLDHISRCEYWELERTTGNLNAWVTLSWDANTSCGVTQTSDLRIARFNSAFWENEGATSVIGPLTGGTLTSDMQLSDFGPFTLSSITTENPLPVELIRFTAHPVEEHVRLDWITASETDNDRFEVERSQDGVEFHHVLSVPGQGTTSSTTYYQERDGDPLFGLTYYRLKQVDTDGSVDYSSLVPVMRTDRTAFHVWADGDLLNIVHPNSSGPYVIMDTRGRTVLSGFLQGVAHSKLEMNGLSKGVYNIVLTESPQISQRFLR